MTHIVYRSIYAIYRSVLANELATLFTKRDTGKPMTNPDNSLFNRTSLSTQPRSSSPWPIQNTQFGEQRAPPPPPKNESRPLGDSARGTPPSPARERGMQMHVLVPRTHCGCFRHEGRRRRRGGRKSSLRALNTLVFLRLHGRALTWSFRSFWRPVFFSRVKEVGGISLFVELTCGTAKSHMRTGVAWTE